MRWRWKAAQEDARRELEAAEERRRHAERLAKRSRKVAARLDYEIAKNGWTEMFQAAMGGR